MANTTPTGNGEGILARQIREAEQQEHAQRQALAQVQAALHRAITDPLIVHRPNTCVAAVGWEGETPMLLIGLPSGDRWDVVLSPKAAEMIVKALTDGPSGSAAGGLRVVGARG